VSTPAPVIDPRDRLAIEEALRARIEGYVPVWRPRAGGAGAALLEVFAGQVATLGGGLNQVPGRSRLAFLDLLGTGLLQARSARAPLVFTLMAGSVTDANVSPNTRVAAPPAPPPASVLTDPEADTGTNEPVVFATTQSVTIARARLAALYSLDPPNDTVADHLAGQASGFTLFDGMEPVPHVLYIGHDRDFAIAGGAVIHLSLRLASYPPETVRQGLEVSWSYWAESGWIPLTLVEDGTQGFTTSGEIVLEAECGPDSALTTIGEHESYWIRGLLATGLMPEGAGGQGRLPAVDLIEQRIAFSKSALQLDAAFADTAPIDTSNRFFPFGPRPALHGTFYLACEEAFSRKNASIRVRFRLYAQVSEPSDDLALSWHYHNGTEWTDLTGFAFEDGTENLTLGAAAQGRIVRFRCPEDWAETEVNGTKGYWLRVRIDAGNYGEPMRLTVDENDGAVTLDQESYDPPIVEEVRLAYDYLTNATLADHCLTSNNEVLTDRTEDARWPRRPFEPFVPLDELQPSVHLGFDQALPPGLVSLYLHTTPEGVTGSESARPSPFVWEYLSANGWTELSVRDETAGFQASGMIQFVGPSDATKTLGRGGELYRVRARLKRGESMEPLPADGLWLNAAWATHREHVERDILGTSDGNPGQSFSLLRATGSVLEGEVVELREWFGSGRDWESVAEDADESAVRLETDSASGAVTAVWVRWLRVDHLFDSGPSDRHYVLEPAARLLRFGDGIHGMIPPARSQVVATYDSGGGVAANVAANTITELRGAVANLESVGNPVAASGGADVESADRVDERGPQRLRHRDRAVTAEDFEWVAREASPAVYHARCRPLTGEAGFAQRGWVTLLIAPNSPSPQPQPSAELRRQVLAHVTARCPAAIAARVRVASPEYVPVSVVCEIVPVEADLAAVVEAQVRANLNAFLHPITGGPGGKGWRFGEPVYLSQVARVVEIETEGVDYAIQLRMTVGSTMFDDMVPVGDDMLVASGAHEIKITLGTG
jgi:hypothetical protein